MKKYIKSEELKKEFPHIGDYVSYARRKENENEEPIPIDCKISFWPWATGKVKKSLKKFGEKFLGH